MKKRLLFSLIGVGITLSLIGALLFWVSDQNASSMGDKWTPIVILITSIFFVLGFTFIILDKLLLQRIDRISTVIDEDGKHASGDRVGYLGEDEVGRLAAKLDEMLAYEEETENELRNQAKTFAEISDIKTVELARQSEALQSLFKSVEQGIGVFDKNLKLSACNDQWRGHLHLPISYTQQGTTLESICLWNAKNGFLGEGDVDELVDTLMGKYKSRQPRTFNRYYDDGVVCEISVFPTIVGGLVFTVTDVTDLHRVQAELKQANESLEQRVEERTKALVQEIAERQKTEEALLESEARLIHAQRLSQVGYWGWGIDTGRSFMSEEYPRILGLDLDSAPQNQTEFNQLLHPDDLERVEAFLEQISMVDPQDYEIDFRIVRPDGEVRFIREIGEVDYDADGNAIGHTGTIQDVTNIKEFELALTRAKEEAEVANRTKSEFLANMSHELRTPLNAIIGFSDILKQETFGPLNSEHYMEYVEDIRDSGGHLLEVLNDILDMSKIEAGEVQLEDTTIHIGEELDRSLRFVSEKAAKKHIDLQVSNEKPDVLLYADRRIFKQIFLNLLSNSLKFTDVGGFISITVELSADNCVCIYVEDNGIGIAEDDIKRVMQPFGQAQGSHTRDFEGTGLGLSLVQNFVNLHDAKFSIESELGTGTKISITFPPERTMNAAQQA